MSLKKEESGRRSVEVEVEVPGTPEEVWQAIATGPGVSAWFVPTQIEERDGGAIVSHFGPGMEARAIVTSWEPPHRFAAESHDLGPDAPLLTTEWIVEARSDGVCAVCVVHSLSASVDDWDGQLTSIESGWPRFFRVLRAYLANFSGLPCSIFRVMGATTEPDSEAWEALARALGLAGIEVEQPWSTPAGVPTLAGQVEWISEGGLPHGTLLRLNEPAPGTAFLFAVAMGGKVYLGIDFYLYGDRAPGAAELNEPLWNDWMKERLASAEARHQEESGR